MIALFWLCGGKAGKPRPFVSEIFLFPSEDCEQDLGPENQLPPCSLRPEGAAAPSRCDEVKIWACPLRVQSDLSLGLRT